MKSTARILSVLCAVLASLAFLTACKKGVPDGAAAFQSASPEMKRLWEGSEAAMTTNGFAAALIQLRQLGNMPGLSADQTAAVGAKSAEINDKMYEAANNNDPAGKKALEEMREVMGR